MLHQPETVLKIVPPEQLTTAEKARLVSIINDVWRELYGQRLVREKRIFTPEELSDLTSINITIITTLLSALQAQEIIERLFIRANFQICTERQNVDPVNHLEYLVFSLFRD